MVWRQLPRTVLRPVFFRGRKGVEETRLLWREWHPSPRDPREELAESARVLLRTGSPPLLRKTRANRFRDEPRPGEKRFPNFCPLRQECREQSAGLRAVAGPLPAATWWHSKAARSCAVVVGRADRNAPKSASPSLALALEQ